MTEQEQKAFDQMREALKKAATSLNFSKMYLRRKADEFTSNAHSPFRFNHDLEMAVVCIGHDLDDCQAALAAANAVSEAQPAGPEDMAIYKSIADEYLTKVQPVDEWTIRGTLAAKLKCWHRLKEDEATELVRLFAANAVSHPKPETTPAPEGGAITSESAANAVSEPVGINGLTAAETSASMSVMGLSKPTVQPQSKITPHIDGTGTAIGVLAAFNQMEQPQAQGEAHHE